jgi:hypothetical protein
VFWRLLYPSRLRQDATASGQPCVLAPTFVLSSFFDGAPPPPSPLSSHLIEPFFSLCSEYSLLFKAERKGEEMKPKKTTVKSVGLLKYIVVKALPVVGGQKSCSNKF